VASQSSNTSLYYNAMVNGSSLHAAGIYPNLIHTAYLQYLTGNTEATILAYNHPLPRTYLQHKGENSDDAFTASLFLMIAFCFIPAGYAIFVVKEVTLACAGYPSLHNEVAYHLNPNVCSSAR
jgi:hypothetical protein